MCKILHIETATEICSVSIADKGDIFVKKETREGKSHAAVLAPYIQGILQEGGLSINNLDAIAVSMGPGSYTGLRIGVSLAKGLCYGAGLPLIAVNTLESMCHGLIQSLITNGYEIPEGILFAPMIDARRMEVFTALFDIRMNVLKETHALVVEAGSFNELLKDHPICFFGSGADKLSGIIVHPNARFIPDFFVSSSHMSSLAYNLFLKSKFEALAYFEPFYLKDFLTTIPKKTV